MEYKTKFEPGQTVWTMLQNKPHQFRIAGIEIYLAPKEIKVGNPSEIYIETINTASRNNPQHLRFGARDCFATKEELFDHLFNLTK